ncbi:MAG: DUF1566 domain-containing protein [Rhodoferax sp.]|nr:DUF1566 domain-containing protein [Rhodoferax sp.]
MDNGNGTVTHTPTNLTWKRCAQGQTWTGSTCSGTAGTYTFEQANALTGTTMFAGQSDWRVPTEDELVSLVDYTIASPGPMINNSVFPATTSSNFWSGSPSANSSSLAWDVYFRNGNAGYNYRSLSSAVRLVRGGQFFGSFVLAVSKNGTGTGTVIGSAAGIDCGSTCSAALASGTSVTLTATPATGSTFTGWSGACSGTGTCTVSMGAAQNVTATFAQSVAAPVCILSADPVSITAGASSTLTATCNPTASSYTWTGGTCAGTTGATCTVTPAATTTYTVAGTNTGGTGAAASATVRLTSSSTPTDMVAYYCFDDPSNLGKDCSTNGNNGAVSGGVSAVSGVNGGGALFGGFNKPGVIRVPNSTSLQFGTTSTLSYFVKIDDPAGMDGYGNYALRGNFAIVAKSHDRTGLVWNAGVDSSGDLQAGFGGFSGVTATAGTDVLVGWAAGAIGRWVHVVHMWIALV